MTNNSSFFSLDLTSFKWSVINQLAADGIEDNLPQALDEHSAIVHDGKMYIFGGFVNGERDNQIFYFDFTTSRWSRINLSDDDAKPCARAGHTTLLQAMVEDNKETPYMYLFGGKDIENDKLNDLWRFNLITNKWEKMDPKGEIPMERSGHSASHYQGHMIVFGGLYEITKELNDSFLYNFKTNTWIPFFAESGSFSPRSISPGSSKKKVRGTASAGPGNETPELV